MRSTYDHILTIDGYEFEATVDYTYYPPCRGARERGTGVPLEPDDPAVVEINSIKIDDIPYDLPEQVEEAIRDTILEEIKDGF